MTRSFGDQVGAQAGVIAEPGTYSKHPLETFTYELQPQNKFMVVASDGVFEYMSNE
jgi:serine/threonine protein phosphatase PrpC